MSAVVEEEVVAAVGGVDVVAARQRNKRAAREHLSEGGSGCLLVDCLRLNDDLCASACDRLYRTGAIVEMLACREQPSGDRGERKSGQQLQTWEGPQSKGLES